MLRKVMEAHLNLRPRYRRYVAPENGERPSPVSDDLMHALRTLGYVQ